MTTPYYSDDKVRLFLGDCEALLPTLTAHVVVTSPPYNMGLTPGGNGRGMYRPSASRKGGRFRAGYGAHDDAMPQHEYDAWQRRIIRLCWDATPDDGAIYYNHRPRLEHGVTRFPLGLDFGVPLRQQIVWDRGTGIGVNKRHYCSVAEYVYLLAKPDFVLRDHSASGAGDVWRLGMAREDYGHPAPFPKALPAKAIHTSAARSILDPFAGTGTTLIAARELGVPAIGIEKDEHWCEVIAKRLAQDCLDLGVA